MTPRPPAEAPAAPATPPGAVPPAEGGTATPHIPRPERAHAERIAALRLARLTAAPTHLPSEHEQATFELGLVVALVLGTPEAARGLDLLVNARRIQPEGAEVFAALLYATGREEGAEFWWRFAAGSGSGTAAYCLHLYHLRYGETDDADYWRAWSDQLAAALGPPGARPRGPTPPRVDRPLLPDDVRRDVLSRCHRGLAPQLPPTLVEVIDRLPRQGDPGRGDPGHGDNDHGDPDRSGDVPSPWGLTSGATSACSWDGAQG
ncbi:hypothetical protein [Kitasatospora sp. NPDC005748]|uniref:hypothetical protein n=1 Tax=Kitasatospora sp. NPDC005748 TaxID=3157063 RepID=UPI0033EE1BBD